jgi:hypothetical protein
MNHAKKFKDNFFKEYLNFVFRDITKFVENFNFKVFEWHNQDYKGFKLLSLKLRIIAMLTGE